MPSQFTANGLGAFASDGFAYEKEIVQLPGVLKEQGMRAWATWPTQLHIRIYSLPLVVLDRWIGFNVMAIEPINLIYYLSILALIFKLGETIFDYRTGIVAAVIVALWPSLLLHTTQLLRDPLLITSFLLLMLALARIIKRDYSWREGLVWGIVGVMAIVVIRIVRMPMWDVLWAIVAMAISLMLLRLIRARTIKFGSVAFVVLAVAAMIFTPHFQPIFRNQQKVGVDRVLAPEAVQELPVPDQIVRRREAFGLQVSKEGGTEPSTAGSDLHNETHLSKIIDIVRYLPRAAEVGFLAPFPNMWLAEGKQVGSAGRLLSGLEMILTYLILGLTLFGLWSRRKDLTSWFLFLSAAAGIIALGLIVTNIGALYRLRYPFWILIVILGAGGALRLVEKKRLVQSCTD